MVYSCLCVYVFVPVHLCVSSTHEYASYCVVREIVCVGGVGELECRWKLVAKTLVMECCNLFLQCKGVAICVCFCIGSLHG